MQLAREFERVKTLGLPQTIAGLTKVVRNPERRYDLLRKLWTLSDRVLDSVKIVPDSTADVAAEDGDELAAALKKLPPFERLEISHLLTTDRKALVASCGFDESFTSPIVHMKLYLSEHASPTLHNSIRRNWYRWFVSVYRFENDPTLHRAFVERDGWSYVTTSAYFDKLLLNNDLQEIEEIVKSQRTATHFEVRRVLVCSLLRSIRSSFIDQDTRWSWIYSLNVEATFVFPDGLDVPPVLRAMNGMGERLNVADHHFPGTQWKYGPRFTPDELVDAVSEHLQEWRDRVQAHKDERTGIRSLDVWDKCQADMQYSLETAGRRGVVTWKTKLWSNALFGAFLVRAAGGIGPMMLAVLEARMNDTTWLFSQSHRRVERAWNHITDLYYVVPRIYTSAFANPGATVGEIVSVPMALLQKLSGLVSRSRETMYELIAESCVSRGFEQDVDEPTEFRCAGPTFLLPRTPAAYRIYVEARRPLAVYRSASWVDEMHAIDTLDVNPRPNKLKMDLLFGEGLVDAIATGGVSTNRDVIQWVDIAVNNFDFDEWRCITLMRSPFDKVAVARNRLFGRLCTIVDEDAKRRTAALWDFSDSPDSPDAPPDASVSLAKVMPWLFDTMHSLLEIGAPVPVHVSYEQHIILRNALSAAHQWYSFTKKDLEDRVTLRRAAVYVQLAHIGVALSAAHNRVAEFASLLKIVEADEIGGCAVLDPENIPLVVNEAFPKF